MLIVMGIERTGVGPLASAFSVSRDALSWVWDSADGGAVFPIVSSFLLLPHPLSILRDALDGSTSRSVFREIHFGPYFPNLLYGVLTCARSSPVSSLWGKQCCLRRISEKLN